MAVAVPDGAHGPGQERRRAVRLPRHRARFLQRVPLGGVQEGGGRAGVGAYAGLLQAAFGVTLEIEPLSSHPETIAALAALLKEVVDGGASVSFMAPLALEDAAAFWKRSLAASDEGGRVVLGAME